jgi:hypothetical protein
VIRLYFMMNQRVNGLGRRIDNQREATRIGDDM